MATSLQAAADICCFMEKTFKTLEECGLLESFSLSYQINVNFPINLFLNSDITSHLDIVQKELSQLSEKCFSKAFDLPISQNLVDNIENRSEDLCNSSIEQTCNETTVDDTVQLCQMAALKRDCSTTTSIDMTDAVENNNLPCDIKDSVREISASIISPDIPRASSQPLRGYSDGLTNLSPAPLAETLLFTCNLCDKQFRYKKNLISHELYIHNIGGKKNRAINLICDICDKVFINKQRLEVHRATHMSQKPFSCKTCGMTFTQKSTRDNHLSQHTGFFKYSCQECPKSFVNQAKLNFHMHKHQEPRHICEICGKTFVRKDVFESHVRSHDPAKNHLCAVCGKAFRSKTFLKRHEMCNHSAAEDSPMHLCAECGCTFTMKSSLKKHMQTHISPSVITTGCLQPTRIQFPRTQSSKDHEANEADKGQQQFHCTQCSRTYKFKHNLKVHEKSHLACSAEVTKPHKCPYCSKRFSKKFRLELHVKTHQQGPDLSCEICGQRFYRREVLRNHIFLHSNQRPYRCDLCEKAFASKANLSVHMTTHNTQSEDCSEGTLVCEYCQRKFKQKASFNAHLKAHRGEFKYECQICNKKFVRKGHFDGHLRSHSKNRPHVCPVCDKGFKEKKHRREHLRRMHPNEFNLDTLFASITSEDVQIAEMITMDSTAQV